MSRCPSPLPLLLLLLALALALAPASAATDTAAKRVMTWLCLEFCSPSLLASSSAQALSLTPAPLTHLSFERYTLGANSSLVDHWGDDLSDMTGLMQQVAARGGRLEPMLSSYPHPPEFADWMHQVFEEPGPFLKAAQEAVVENGYQGMNLDWEPTEGVEDGDDIRYADFIDQLSRALHEVGATLSVDVATWSPIWNYTAIAETSVDRVITMGTYTGTDDSFLSQLDTAISAFGTERLGVGMQDVNASTGGRMPIDDIAWRLETIQDAGVKEVDIWRATIPPLWVPLLQKFYETP